MIKDSKVISPRSSNANSLWISEWNFTGWESIKFLVLSFQFKLQSTILWTEASSIKNPIVWIVHSLVICYTCQELIVWQKWPKSHCLSTVLIWLKVGERNGVNMKLLWSCRSASIPTFLGSGIHKDWTFPVSVMWSLWIRGLFSRGSRAGCTLCSLTVPVEWEHSLAQHIDRRSQLGDSDANHCCSICSVWWSVQWVSVFWFYLKLLKKYFFNLVLNCKNFKITYKPVCEHMCLSLLQPFTPSIGGLSASESRTLCSTELFYSAQGI